MEECVQNLDVMTPAPVFFMTALQYEYSMSSGRGSCCCDYCYLKATVIARGSGTLRISTGGMSGQVCCGCKLEPERRQGGTKTLPFIMSLPVSLLPTCDMASSDYLFLPLVTTFYHCVFVFPSFHYYTYIKVSSTWFLVNYHK